MSVNNVKKYLEDILMAINNVESSTIGLEAKHYQNYEVSWIVERGIEIIAEALKRIISFEPNIAIANTSKIIATRNKITHEYDVVDSYQLYVIATKYFPELKKEVEKLLNK